MTNQRSEETTKIAEAELALDNLKPMVTELENQQNEVTTQVNNWDEAPLERVRAAAIV